MRIDVQALSIADTAELLGRTLEGPVDANTARRLFEASQGNVLLLREIVLSGGAIWDPPPGAAHGSGEARSRWMPG